MEKLYTKKETAEYLKISERSVDRMLFNSDLLYYRVGRQIRVPEISLKQMLQKGITSSDLETTIEELLGE